MVKCAFNSTSYVWSSYFVHDDQNSDLYGEFFHWEFKNGGYNCWKLNFLVDKWLKPAKNIKKRVLSPVLDDFWPINQIFSNQNQNYGIPNE